MSKYKYNELFEFNKKIINTDTLIKSLPKTLNINDTNFNANWTPIQGKPSVISNIIIPQTKGEHGTWIQSIIVISISFTKNKLTMTQRVSNTVELKQVKFKEIPYYKDEEFKNSNDLLDKIKTSLSMIESKLSKLVKDLKYNENYLTEYDKDYLLYLENRVAKLENIIFKY
jgi:hypothetical protein